MNPKIIRPEEIGQAVIYKVDWSALFQFHVERSIDRSLSASRRRWHEAQASAVRSRHIARTKDTRRQLKTLLMASLAQMWHARHVKDPKKSGNVQLAETLSGGTRNDELARKLRRARARARLI